MSTPSAAGHDARVVSEPLARHGQLEPAGIEPLLAATGLAENLGAPVSYLLAYGSHATGRQREASDLDLLVVAPRPITAHQTRCLRDRVIRLHDAHRLDLDTEVAYEVKLVATHTEIDHALSLVAFHAPDHPTRIVANSVPSDIAYLNSATFKLRLLLNALTVPSVFLGGDLLIHRRHALLAEVALARLAVGLLHERTTGKTTQSNEGAFAVGDAVDVLLNSPDGTTGKDYLGYTSAPAVLDVLLRGLHRLQLRGDVDHPTASTWRIRPQTDAGARACLPLGY